MENCRNKMYADGIVIFDLDGTLLDTREGVIDALVYTLYEVGLDIPDNDELKKFVGPPMQQSLARYYGMSMDRAIEIANTFRKNYKDRSLFKAKLYPNVLQTMSMLKKKGYKVAIATNKSHDNAMSVLQYFHISDYCDYAKGSDLACILTKKDILLDCCDNLFTKPENSVFIGDSSIDLTGAEEANIKFIAVTYGFGFKKDEKIESHCLLGVVNQIEDIMQYL